MQASNLNSLIETLVQTIETDAAALRQRYLLRQAMHALARQAQAEQMARVRRDALWLAGRDGCGQQGPQQACGQQC
jgi:hypothetical protein